MARPIKYEKKETTETTLTADERALADRLSSGDTSWKTITEGDIVDFSLAKDQYELPKEAQDMQDKKKFAFRWVEADPKRIDQVRALDPPAKWWICNAMNTPFLAKYCDPMHGGIQRLDQILVFKPWWMHRAYQDAKMMIHTSKTETADITKKSGSADNFGSEWVSGEKANIRGGDLIMEVPEESSGEGLSDVDV